MNRITAISETTGVASGSVGTTPGVIPENIETYSNIDPSFMLICTTLVEGDGEAVVSGNRLKIRYKAVNMSSNSVFDGTTFEDAIEANGGVDEAARLAGSGPGGDTGVI